MKNKISINDLYFGIMLDQGSFCYPYEGPTFKVHNLFDSSRVKHSVALWVTMSEEKKDQIRNPLMWCFGDVFGHREYEFGVCPLWEPDKAEKMDIYRMYVEPNAELLMDMVNSVSLTSAKKYIAEVRKRNRR